MSAPVGLDTNVLVRYFVAPGDDPAEQRQHLAAGALIDSGQSLRVSKTVLLELEWVLRGFYRYRRAEVGRVLRHLAAQPHIAVEDRSAVERALDNYAAGFDFADALHHASYADCDWVASFDDLGFAGRGRRLGLQPPVKVPPARS
ncbi:MAG TPA: type II toxin-antitoxin system VapC family toxin [Steroidobacteraceae bacterium]|nr:type II toxin-antitoxin system VapC family toxin [Steroidobacteraceae bacterium]